MQQQQANFHEAEGNNPDATYSGYTSAPPYQQKSFSVFLIRE